MSPLLNVVQVGCLVAVASTVGMVALAVLSAPSLPPERLGLRGAKRMRALQRKDAFARVEPLMRWLSTRGGGLLSPRLRAHLDPLITRAGDVLGLNPEDVVSLSGMSFLAGTLAAVLYLNTTDGSMLVALIVPVVAGCVPYLQLVSASQRRMLRIQSDLPQVIDLLVLGLGAGLDFTAAVRQVVDRARSDDQPLIEELSLLLQEFKIGRTRRQGLAMWMERVPCVAVRDLVGAATQSEEQGTPLAEVLAAQATASRHRRSSQAEEKAAKANTKLLIPLALLFLGVLMLIIGPMVISLSERF